MKEELSVQSTDPPPYLQEVIPEGFTNLAYTQDEKPQEDKPDEPPKESSEKSKGKGKKEKKSKKKKEPVKTVGFFQLFRYATCLEVLLMLIGLLCAAAHGIALPLMCVVFGQMTDSFVLSGQKGNLTGNFTENFTFINSSTCLAGSPEIGIEDKMTEHAYYFVAIGAAVLILGTFQVMLFLLTAAKQTKRIREKYFHAILHQQMSWFDMHQIGELNIRLTDLTSKELTAYANAGAVAEEILFAFRTVVAFNGQKKAVEKYEKNLVEAKNFGVKKAITTNVSMGLTQFIIFGTYALAFWYGTKLSVDEPENYSIGRVIIVFFSVMIGAFSLGQGAPNLESIATARGAAYEVYKTIDMPRPIDSSSKEGHKPDHVKGDIEFKNIHFSYPSRKDVKILQGMNLKVPHGKTIALVGASGCGKSTTIQLLQRFYDPDSGEVTLDGHDIRSLNVCWLRENMGIVSQEPVLFGTTITENIRYGREDATDEDIERAIKEANAYDFISKLPDKLNTMVGERGAQLSGGQKQRIAIARALIKNPKILLLDEATSALDTQSESIVQAALDKARAGRTTIVIAHRLSTIRSADIIAGFSEGKVVEQGTHRELMAKKGVYYSLVMQQTSGRPNDDLDGNEYDIQDVSEGETSEESSETETPEGGMERQMESGRSLRRGSERRSSRKKSSAKKKSKKSKKDKKEKENVSEIPFTKILALNKPEWPYLLVGTLASLVGGAVYPCVAILFAKIVGVFAEVDPEVKRQKTMIFSLFFLLTGAVAFITYFFQEIAWFDDDNNAVGVLTTKLATDASLVKGAITEQPALLVSAMEDITEPPNFTAAAIVSKAVFTFHLRAVVVKSSAYAAMVVFSPTYTNVVGFSSVCSALDGFSSACSILEGFSSACSALEGFSSACFTTRAWPAIPAPGPPPVHLPPGL
ncbi:hypothetical protein cypCar_00031749 [Cyprinus carpio]|nr:hypothetical protein cypCar_00031749 [Cyprinus carpio]